jgi:hypothetical protein
MYRKYGPSTSGCLQTKQFEKLKPCHQTEQVTTKSIKTMQQIAGATEAA